MNPPPAAQPAFPDMDNILSQLTGQITKAAAGRDDAVVAVMKEVRALLLKMEDS